MEVVEVLEVLDVAHPKVVGLDERGKEFVERAVGKRIKEGTFVRVSTRSNFPPATGVASSASGFAALSVALARMGGESRFWAEQWARIGSGSAVRSVPCAWEGKLEWEEEDKKDEKKEEKEGIGWLVEWEGSCAKRREVHPSMLGMVHILVVMDALPKKHGSSEGHSRAGTSLFHCVRTSTADGNVRKVKEAMKRGDWDLFSSVTESESSTMHMVMATSSPPLWYVGRPTLELVSAFCRFREERRLKACWTADAGANVHLLVSKEAEEEVRGFLHSAKHAWTLCRGVEERRYGCLLLSGKRFSGKTAVASEIVRLLSEKGVDAREYAISSAIKAAHCSKRGLDESCMYDRSVKEAERKEMIRMADAARERDPYVWCREVWSQVQVFPHFVVVSDARREADVAFFRAMTRCSVVRIHASDEKRQKRGWSRSPVDEMVSETGLDSFEFDSVVDNDDREPCDTARYILNVDAVKTTVGS